ncbi:alpha/beta-hydrolase [Xylaria bambusicola]|uniref:alpha/beta-hydrolase n=1 Tax=Xylaria bambusicola TaxID=326684 RepID=UPI0020075660|nr:alpha/beta-hydrolase [Xylaria bambusicola]KAI0506057.1 alpha/beta-hydrolase [Xylaria bambusicola]
MNTATVSMAVTPTVLSTFLSHYLNRKPLRERPTAHLSYDEGLHLIRSFLYFASQHTVEELQAFTAQWVPHPQWVKVKEVEIPEETLLEAADALQEQLGPEGVRLVGGKNWWQWRRPESPLKAEWIEMRSDYNERIKSGDELGKRVMLYVHGGGYFFGSVDEHRYQMQRHARKLKARVFAPEYRLAPQFPFPCGLQDCLAAYFHLLKTHEPSSIILAGDSAGGGMVLSVLVTLRDRGLPLPAGAILISPWVDLTHSFPSVSGDCPLDYIPPNGFHHKPSESWPPLNADEYVTLKEEVSKRKKSNPSKQLPEAENPAVEQSMKSRAETTYLRIHIDGKEVVLKDQIQMYTTNELLSHPLVSPIMQPSLGGLPPLLIMTGGGEILRDEQIYLAHKCANPDKYPPGDTHLNETAKEQISLFKPTDVQLQIWDDLCHVAPTLSFTRPAKYMYRSVAQFGAWALARAQKTEIEILDDDQISIISSSNSSSGEDAPGKEETKSPGPEQSQVGKAGDPLPPFKNHMIRQRVSRHGIIRPLEPAVELPACTLDPNEIGVIKQSPVQKWLEARHQWDTRFASTRAKVHKKRLKEMMAGYQGFDGETPPPSALAARRKAAGALVAKKKKKSMGLALWSLWGSKHDEMTVQREEEAGKPPEMKIATKQEGHGARSPSDLERQERDMASQRPLSSRSPSKTKIVRDENQTLDSGVIENTPIAVLMAKREGKIPQDAAEPLPSRNNDSLSPYYVPPSTGATGKRPIVSGIAVPFSLGKEAETASMITLTSAMDQSSRVASPISPDPRMDDLFPTSATAMMSSNPDIADAAEEPPTPKVVDTNTPAMITPLATPLSGGSALERPPLETFVTAQEELPKVQ